MLEEQKEIGECLEREHNVCTEIAQGSSIEGLCKLY
jgi:hypothetical protein